MFTEEECSQVHMHLFVNRFRERFDAEGPSSPRGRLPDCSDWISSLQPAFSQFSHWNKWMIVDTQWKSLTELP